MKKQKQKSPITLGKVKQSDLEKILKKVSREVFGFIPTKIHKNKKKYSRKVKHKE